MVEYQPPLTRWRHAWRLIVMLLISGLIWASVADDEWDSPDHRWFLFDLAVGVLAYALVHLRRRWPVVIAIVLTLIGGVSGLAAGPTTLASVSLATHRRIRPILAVGVLNIAAGMFYNEVLFRTDQTSAWWVNLSVTVVFTAAVMGWGMYLGSRRELIWTLHQRAERAEAEQELRASQTRVTERSRIAREMHDVLAHRISQISMHAGALSFREDLSAEQMRESATVIQQAANQALTDLRAVLGVLRDPDTGTLTTEHVPQPTYVDLPALVEQARATGLNIEYDDDLLATPPDALGRTIYRIVQEGMTNARKHAPGALLNVRLSGDPESGVDLVVRNPLGFTRSAPPGSGLGLLGIGERVQLGGGRLRHGVVDAGFELHAWLPWAP